MLRLTLILAVVFLLITSCKQSDDSSYLQTITSGLEAVNKSIDEYNGKLLHDLHSKLNDAMTVDKAQIWQPKAEIVHRYATEILFYIDNIKSEIQAQSKKKSLSDEERKKNLLEQFKTLQFFPRLDNFKKQVVTVMNTEFFADRPPYREELKRDSQSILQELPLFANNIGSDSAFKTAEYALCVAMLQTLASNVLVSENRLLRYFNIHSTSINHGFEQYNPMAFLSSSYVKSGETIEVTSGIGAFSVSAKPSITIDGKQMETGVNGTAVYSFRASKKPGRHTVQVQIEYTQPDGIKKVYTKNCAYTIAP